MSMQIQNTTRFLLAASFLGTAAESMLVPIYAPLAHRAGGSLVDTGLGLALFSITTGIFVTTIGVTDWFRHHIRKFLVLGFVLAGAADLGYIFVHSRSELFFVQTMVGLALGILNPAWDSIYSVGPEDPTRKWAIWTGGVSLVTGLAALAGTFVLSHYSFNTVFEAMFGLDLLAAYCSFVAIRPRHPRNAARRGKATRFQAANSHGNQLPTLSSATRPSHATSSRPASLSSCVGARRMAPEWPCAQREVS